MRVTFASVPALKQLKSVGLVKAEAPLPFGKTPLDAARMTR